MSSAEAQNTKFFIQEEEELKQKAQYKPELNKPKCVTAKQKK